VDPDPGFLVDPDPGFLIDLDPGFLWIWIQAVWVDQDPEAGFLMPSNLKYRRKEVCMKVCLLRKLPKISFWPQVRSADRH
jgi:hypothetical protein